MMDEHLSHYGIKGQSWGDRRFQNYDGSLTTAGRERYGSSLGRLKKTLGRYKTGAGTVKSIVGQKVKRAKSDLRMLGEDVRDYSNTYKKANSAYKKARFGVALAKAKADQYKNTGRYKFRQAKSSVSRALRGKDANRNIERINQRIQWDYKASRAQAKGFIDHIAKRTYKSVMSASNDRFKYRMSMGERYADAVKKLSLDDFYKGNSRRVSIGAASLTGFKYIDTALPEMAIGRRSLPGLTRIRMR